MVHLSTFLPLVLLVMSVSLGVEGAIVSPWSNNTAIGITTTLVHVSVSPILFPQSSSDASSLTFVSASSVFPLLTSPASYAANLADSTGSLVAPSSSHTPAGISHIPSEFLLSTSGASNLTASKVDIATDGSSSSVSIWSASSTQMTSIVSSTLSVLAPKLATSPTVTSPSTMSLLITPNPELTLSPESFWSSMPVLGTPIFSNATAPIPSMSNTMIPSAPATPVPTTPCYSEASSMNTSIQPPMLSSSAPTIKPSISSLLSAPASATGSALPMPSSETEFTSSPASWSSMPGLYTLLPSAAVVSEPMTALQATSVGATTATSDLATNSNPISYGIVGQSSTSITVESPFPTPYPAFFSAGESTTTLTIFVTTRTSGYQETSFVTVIGTAPAA